MRRLKAAENPGRTNSLQVLGDWLSIALVAWGTIGIHEAPSQSNQYRKQENASKNFNNESDIPLADTISASTGFAFARHRVVAARRRGVAGESVLLFWLRFLL